MAENQNGRAKGRGSFNGIGVLNVNERIRLFFGQEYGLHYESELGQYTRCVFRLPVVEKVLDKNEEFVIWKK